MSRSIEAKCGDNIYVVKLSDNVHVLVNISEGVCMFARYPDSFYKQGYFERFEGKVKAVIARKIAELIRTNVEELDEDNAWRKCFSLTAEDVKSAFRE